MVFSSVEFLFYFLPLTLALYFLAPTRLRNLVLLGASLFFYAWGELAFVLLMVASVSVNFLVAGRIAGTAGGAKRRWLAVGVVGNLGALGFFKYFSFAIENLSSLFAVADLPPLPNPEVHLPIGISFFTFQALSYLVDLYRGDVRHERKLLNVALYIAMFPQLIAGPIVRFRQISAEVNQRRHTINRAAWGAHLFLLGLAYQVLIANVVSGPADRVFALQAAQLSTGTAWLGTVCYTLQIYFDFAGYSLMAVGLGRIFGFRFPRNFNYPYIATSVTEWCSNGSVSGASFRGAGRRFAISTPSWLSWSAGSCFAPALWPEPG